MLPVRILASLEWRLSTVGDDTGICTAEFTFTLAGGLFHSSSSATVIHCCSSARAHDVSLMLPKRRRLMAQIRNVVLEVFSREKFCSDFSVLPVGESGFC